MGEGVHAGSALPVPAVGCGSVPDTHCVVLGKGQRGVMPTARWGWGIRHAGMGALGVYPDPPPPFLPKLRCSGGQIEPGSASGSQLWTSALMERTCSQAPSGSLSGVPMPALHPQPPLGSWVGAGRACVAPEGPPTQTSLHPLPVDGYQSVAAALGGLGTPMSPKPASLTVLWGTVTALLGSRSTGAFWGSPAVPALGGGPTVSSSFLILCPSWL